MVLYTGLAGSVYPSVAFARLAVSPHIEVRAVFTDNVSADGSSGNGIIGVVQPGVTLAYNSAHLNFSLDYDLSARTNLTGRDFDTTGRIRNDLRARGQFTVVDKIFFVDTGAIVTQLFIDPRGAVTLNPDSLNNNLRDVANYYIEPSIHTRLNQYADLTLGIRGAWTRTKSQPDDFVPVIGGPTPTSLLSTGQQISPSNDQNAYVTLSSGSYFDRIKWSLRGSWNRDERDYLNELYRAYSGTADVEVPIVRGFNLVGSAGYEDTKDNEDVVITDPVTGQLVLTTDAQGVQHIAIDRSEAARNGTLSFIDSNGRTITRDGRILDRRGFIWDVGFHWLPSRRTDLLVRGGRRYGGTTINVTGRHIFSKRSSVQFSYGTSLDSLSRLLTQSDAAGNILTVQQVSSRATPVYSPLFGFVNGLNRPSFIGSQAINNSTFLSRTAVVTYTFSGTRTYVELNLSGEDRQLLSLQQLPSQPRIDPASVGDDRAIAAQLLLRRTLGNGDSVDASINGRYNEYALEAGRRDALYGGTIGYNIFFTPHLNLNLRYLYSERDSNIRGNTLKENNFTVALQARF